MKKSTLHPDDAGMFPSPDDGNGAVMPSPAADKNKLFFDDGEPFPLAGASVVTIVSTNAAKPVAAISTLADYLVNGFWQYNNTIAHHWASSTITYNINGLNAAEQFLAQSALQAWHDVANVTFVQTAGAANITFNDAGTMQAVTNAGWYSNGAIASATVDISQDWITNDGGAMDGKTGIDSYGYQTYIHEIGHALGLGHQGPYNGSASYSTNALYADDTWQYSIMSYFAENNYSGSTYRYVVTPQMADIYAVDQIYGAASTTRTGDTVYGFHSNAGSVYDFSAYTRAPAFTIYDGGGNETLDCSGYSVVQTIDLHAGAFSSVGGLVNNIGISLNTTIENAIGGSGNDIIVGNPSANVLNGGAGDDTLTGGGGNDAIIGDSGTDTAVFFGNRASYRVTYSAATLTYTVTDQRAGAPDGTDTVSGVEIFQFADVTLNASAAISNQPPVVVASNLQEIQGVSAGSLSVHLQYSDPDGDAAFHWRLQDVSSDSTAAVMVNGVALAPGGAAIEVTQAQFAAATLQPVSGTHEIWAVASDGTSWSNPVHFTVSPAVAPAINHAPVVVASNLQEVQAVSAGALSAHLQYSDADGDAAFHWRLQDVSSDSAAAVMVNGVALAPGGAAVEVTQAQFAAAIIQSVSGTHEIWAVTSDGFAWSSPVHFTVSPAVVPATNHAPVVAASNLQEVQAVSAGALSAHLQYSDADGDAAFHWRLQDVSSDSTAAVTINGVALAPGVPPIEVTQAQFATAIIQSVSGTHEIWAVASDSFAWSSPVHFTVSPAASQSAASEQAFETAELTTVDHFAFATWLLH